jgi:hypothetical protein
MLTHSFSALFINFFPNNCNLRNSIKIGKMVYLIIHRVGYVELHSAQKRTVPSLSNSYLLLKLVYNLFKKVKSIAYVLLEIGFESPSYL